jgi:aspartate carbamoyltransferase catalytic subunit
VPTAIHNATPESRPLTPQANSPPPLPGPLPGSRPAPKQTTHRDLVGLQGMPPGDLRAILTRTRQLDSTKTTAPSLAGKTIANLFFEDSTRTRSSFTVAAQRLGANVLDLLGGTSSVNKGETLIDTARNVEAMGVAGLVVRARQAGAAAMIADSCDCPVINAGDGKHEHPTQGLLDIYTIAESHLRLDNFDLTGLRIAIVGDVASSRVARSGIAGLRTLGASLVCVGPPNFAPASLANLGVDVSSNLDSIVGDVDAVMMLRIQFERHADADSKPGETKKGSIASIREFREFYALTNQRAQRMKPGAVVMHPGPINRGIELDADVADGPRSVILRQVTNGVTVRMAVLERACVATPIPNQDKC